MTTLLDHLQDFSQALVREPLDAMQTLHARAWAARHQPAPPLRTRARIRGEAAPVSATPLERAVADLLARLDDNRLVELRASAPRLAGIFDALRVGPRREAWIRELFEHASRELTRTELDRAATTLNRDQGAAFGVVLVLVGT